MDSTLASLVTKTLKAEGLTNQQAKFELLWVSRRRIQKLNRDFRGIDQPTDVLSFPLYSFTEIQQHLAIDEPLLLGTLTLCRSVMRANARLNGRSLEAQLNWSVQHGLKHLLGYDHDEAGEHWHPIMTPKQHRLDE